MSAERRLFGMELVLDLHGCDGKVMRSRAKLDAFARKLCRWIKMKRYGEPLLEHFGHKDPVTAGYSLVQLIETSSITGHFSEKTGSAYLNIFSCKEFCGDDAAKFCKEYFGAKKVVKRFIIRP